MEPLWIVAGVISCVLSVTAQIGSASATPHRLRLGYLTGSQKRPDDLFYEKPGQTISGAITLATEEINNDPYILPNTRMEFTIAETYGEEEESIRQTVRLLEEQVDAVIGPQETCIHEGRLAAAFNKPVVSYFCTSPELSDKLLYPTFARSKHHDSQISVSLVSLLQKYDWRKLVFVYNNKKPELAENILHELKAKDFTVTDALWFDGPYFPDASLNASPFIRIVGDTYQKTRVYVMLADFYEFEGLLMALKLKGLTDTGEYIVVGVDSKQYDSSDPQKYIEGDIIMMVLLFGMLYLLMFIIPYDRFFQKETYILSLLQGLLRQETSPEAAAAFQCFLLVAPAAPVYPWFENFTRVVNHYLEAPPFNFTNQFSERGILKILRPEAAYLYDAVWIYARAAHQAILNGESPSDGRTILNYIKGTTYLSAMGFINHINMHGDAQGNFTLLARKLLNRKDGQYGMFPVGTFLLNQNNTRFEPLLQLVEGGIEWIGGRVPVDEPECGFEGEYCVPTPNHLPEIIGGSLAGVFFIAVIIGVVLYRNWRYEQELSSLLWKVDYKDLELQEHSSQYTAPSGYHGYMGFTTSQSLSAKIPSGLRSSMGSLNSQMDFDLRQVFTQIGRHKGQIVAVKTLHKRSVDLTRTVQKELKLIRDCRHSNLNPFIGACVDHGRVCIISEYCSKGSLQDILANDDLRLDDMFIASLVFDIIKGMTFLHDSEIHCHGRLKSSNCVVDSRWVLKITDYGLREFKNGHDVDKEMTEHQYYQSLLWSAPELLRTQGTTKSGTQKSDIFSFAIILYEIHGRNGPYGDIALGPKEIISRVQYPRNGDLFRPRLSLVSTVNKAVTECIQECWQEDPLQRPDFKAIRRMLKPIQKGMKSNILDNMMAMMEKYASNLEEIVDERTDMLREEKKKTEELLHQMLPRSVADQLKMGKRVEAEAFDLVTIYFSDICGFTALSSESTPMQIVDLLNDLYTTFDNILENYDVYKVETIGDAYMVVSGLPKRNGVSHAGEIASMSLHLLDAIQQFKIHHRPNDTLKLRIGIHTGPCVAGVVGSKMPRYCLFGDTVNTASRMESNGLPLKIHSSKECKELLDKMGGYKTEERGLIPMKGKGEMLTYWVTGEYHPRRKNSVFSAIDTSPCTQYREHSPYLSRGSKKLGQQQQSATTNPSSPKLLRYRHSIDTTGLLLPAFPPDKLNHHHHHHLLGGSSTKLLNGSNGSAILSPDDSSLDDGLEDSNCDIKSSHDNYVVKLNKANNNSNNINNPAPHRRAASVRIRFNDEPVCNNHQEMIRSTSRLQDNTIWEKGGEGEGRTRPPTSPPEVTPLLLSNKENGSQVMNHVGGGGGGGYQRTNRARECEV